MTDGPEGEAVRFAQVVRKLLHRIPPHTAHDHVMVRVVLWVPDVHVLEQSAICSEYVILPGPDLSSGQSLWDDSGRCDRFSFWWKVVKGHGRPVAALPRVLSSRYCLNSVTLYSIEVTGGIECGKYQYP